MHPKIFLHPSPTGRLLCVCPMQMSLAGRETVRLWRDLHDLSSTAPLLSPLLCSTRPGSGKAFPVPGAQVSRSNQQKVSEGQKRPHVFPVPAGQMLLSVHLASFLDDESRCAAQRPTLVDYSREGYWSLIYSLHHSDTIFQSFQRHQRREQYHRKQRS